MLKEIVSSSEDISAKTKSVIELKKLQLLDLQRRLRRMESIIVTVTGYHGSQRFNLIRLIARTGASYVGNMNQSVTHLVCWKFEGRKYELAKKFKIAIVNHCWIEECIKKGRRVPEDPYRFQSGEDIGPLVLEIPLGVNQSKAQSKELRNSKRPVFDVEREHVNDAVLADSFFGEDDSHCSDKSIGRAIERNSWKDCPSSSKYCSEKLSWSKLLEEKDDSHCSEKSIGRAIKRNSRKDCPSSSKYCSEKLSWSKLLELGEASTSQASNSGGLKKRNSSSPEPRSKGRRLVKKHISIKDWLLTSNVEDECKELEIETRNKSRGVELEWHQSISNGHASDTIGQYNANTHDGVQEIVHLDEEDENTHANGVLYSLANSEAAHVDSTRLDPVVKVPASSELSCVICWTDFSSTRGVLPCGHRFCFSCIQTWADHMTARRKGSTCPLCKASFICITKVDDAVSSDQKIYSQSIINGSSNMDHYILPPDETYTRLPNLSAPVCCQCLGTEPEDLLVKCHFCQNRSIHTYCLDPPSFPWVCVHCNDLQRLYLHSR